jgi:hypothetical protein
LPSSKVQDFEKFKFGFMLERQGRSNGQKWVKAKSSEIDFHKQCIKTETEDSQSRTNSRRHRRTSDAAVQTDSPQLVEMAVQTYGKPRTRARRKQRLWAQRQKQQDGKLSWQHFDPDLQCQGCPSWQ